MERALLIQVFYGDKDQEGKIATGYPVGKDRILTVRHAFADAGERIDTARIRIRWYGQKNGARDWQGIDDVAWDGADKGLDAVLLKTSFPESITRWGYLVWRRPKGKDFWQSEGFAEVGRIENGYPPTPMQGDSFEHQEDDATFYLGTDYATEMEEGWRGTSGSPVFVQGAIVGLIESCPPNFKAKRLKALWVGKLLVEESFRREIGYEKEETQRQVFEAKLVALLRRSEKAMDALCVCCRKRGQAPGAGKNARATDLAEWLLKPQEPHRFEDLEQACRALVDDHEFAAAAMIQEAACLVAAARFETSIVDAIRARKAREDRGLQPIPASKLTVADVIMASVDRRPVHCARPSDDNPWPIGSFVIPTPPEGGILQQAPEDVAARYHDQIIGKFVDPNTQVGFSREDQIGSASRRFAAMARRQQTRYFLFQCSHTDDRVPEQSSQTEQQHLDAVASLLTNAYPAAPALLLSSDSRLLEQQEIDYEAFVATLAIETDLA